jgi:hypothetical protein
MKPRKPTVKNEELRMPAEEFDRIMRNAFQGSTSEPKGDPDKPSPAKRHSKNNK